MLLRDGAGVPAAIRRVLSKVLPWTCFLPAAGTETMTAELV